MNISLETSLLDTLWARLVPGISFVAQPAKFSTPQLSRPITLAAGRRMFRAIHRVEIVLAIVALTLNLACANAPPWPLCGAMLFLLIQMVILMPRLSARVDPRLAGWMPSARPRHAAFGASEVAKLALLTLGALLPLLHPAHSLPHG